MTRTLQIRRAGPAVTVQDMGRPGYLASGLSQGGAADPLALHEGAALLNQPASSAAIEMAGYGGEFEASEDIRIALTGAPMNATIDGDPVAWNASHLLPKGAVLSIGGTRTGNYGYLHLGGGVATPPVLGSRSAHLTAGIGAPLQPGETLPLDRDQRADLVNRQLLTDPRFDGGKVRVIASLQTALFDPSEIARFQNTTFQRDTRGSRMGVPVVPDGAGFQSATGLSILSETIVPGDIQITGDGTPFVLLAECQTTGGYPRIGTVIPADLPRVAQCPANAALRFAFISLDEAVAVQKRELQRQNQLHQTVERLIRDPRDMADLLSYQLISGVTAGADPE